MELTRGQRVRHLSNNEANQITREAICTALVTLMETKDFNKISISELVRKAGVSRQSFYRNYDSKEQIVAEIGDTILSAFSASLNSPKYTNRHELWYVDFFSFVQKNRPRVEVLRRSNLSDLLFSRLSGILEKWAGHDSAEAHYYIVGIVGAVKSITLEWAVSGFRESPETIAGICMSYDVTTIRG